MLFTTPGPLYQHSCMLVTLSAQPWRCFSRRSTNACFRACVNEPELSNYHTSVNTRQVIKAGSGGVYCHNARGRMQTGGPIPRPLGRGIGRIVRPSPSALWQQTPPEPVLITIITWHFQFHPMNVSILHLKGEYDVQSESLFPWYSHCYVTWCLLCLVFVVSLIIPLAYWCQFSDHGTVTAPTHLSV